MSFKLVRVLTEADKKDDGRMTGKREFEFSLSPNQFAKVFAESESYFIAAANQEGGYCDCCGTGTPRLADRIEIYENDEWSKGDSKKC